MKNLSLKTKLFAIAVAILALASLWLIPGPQRRGAMVVVEPAKRMSQQGQEWETKINIVSNVPVNAADVMLTYPTTLIEGLDVSQDGAQFETTVFEPKLDVSKGQVQFISATLQPVKDTPALLGKIKFRAKTAAESEVLIKRATVVAHDGKGTNVYVPELSQSVGMWMVRGVASLFGGEKG